MAQNFLACDRDQVLLLAPSLRDWLPEDHFAWFVLDAVAAMDLSAFYAAYRHDGHGRAAFDPAMMVALLLYAYAKGQRSSRVIERECVEDIAYRVIAANQRPDHTTVARFRQRHQDALAGLFGEVLGLCAQAGLVQVGVIAIDVTKVHANASERATCEYEQIAREILAEADAVDREEDERFGERRGDELPEPLTTDPDSRNVKTPRGWVQGYNAQAAANARQIVVAAELTNSSADFGQIGPMVAAVRRELRAAGVAELPEVVLADAGYWHRAQMQALAGEGIQVLIPPDARKRKGARPGWDGGLYAFMRRVLATPAGAALYRKRSAMIEPVFADTKFNRKIDRFQRRGRAACRSEWRLITATHNLLKLHKHTTAPLAAQTATAARCA